MADGPALPAFTEFVAPPQWSAIDFISDLHLAEDTPRTFAAWSDYLRATPASAVFMLGDLFEVWIGDDARHEGFEARCCEVLADAAGRRTVALMVGNRDFLVGSAMLRACGLLALPDPTVLDAFGQRLLLSHGDLLCVDDRDYQRFRAMVRSETWQRDFLALPLAERREEARRIRSMSQERKASRAPAEWIDVDGAAALRWLDEADAPVLVHGHTHRPGQVELAPGRVREVLSDWDLEGQHGSPRAQVLRLGRDGALARLDLAAACAQVVQ